MLNETVFSKGLFALSEVFNRNISDTLSEIYYDVLKNATDDQFKNAVNQIIQTNKYNCMPKPAEILEHIYGKPQDKSLEAWEITLNAVRSVGGYKTPVFEDQAISDTIQHLGGWVKLCDTPTAEMVWVQKEFEKFYSIFKRNPRNAKLNGLIDYENGQIGEKTDTQVLIGGRKQELLKGEV